MQERWRGSFPSLDAKTGRESGWNHPSSPSLDPTHLAFISTRKELKIRPGFTPQEDVGRFRPARQTASESTKSVIPGSNRPAPAKPSNPDNPFAQPSQPKTKAQLKNEKRREKKRAEVADTKNWDESSGEEDEDGGKGMREAFEKADEERVKGGEDSGGSGSSSEQAGTSAGGGDGGAPAPTLSQASQKSISDHVTQDTTQILSPVPPRSDTPETASQIRDATTTNAGSILDDSSIPTVTFSKAKSKPHPIQGGRQGPIGLAHPPPIPSDKPSWRPKPNTSNTSESKSSSKPQTTSSSPSKSQTTPKAPPDPEPRVRKDVKIRQGGANDMSSLASRVKNLVLENQRGSGQREQKESASGETT